MASIRIMAKWTIKLASHDGVSRMANFSQTDFSHVLKSKNGTPSESTDFSAFEGDFGVSCALPKTGATRRGVGEGEGLAGMEARADTLLDVIVLGVIGGATGGIGGAMGGIDAESEVFCDTLEPQRID